MKPIQPISLELEYYRDIKKTVDAWSAAVIKYSSMLPASDERQDGFDDEIARFLAAVTGEWNTAFAEINFARRFGQTAIYNWNIWIGLVKRKTRFELPGTQPYSEPGMERALTRWVNKNTALIKGFKEQRDQQLTDKIYDAVKRGRSRKQLIAEILPNVRTLNETIAGRTNLTAEQRASLIATDQILTANADLNELRMANANVTYYTWQGMADARERPAHLKLNGCVFRRDGKPMTTSDYKRLGISGQAYNHPTESDSTATAPGVPVRCRCYGEAHFAGSVYDAADTLSPTLAAETNRRNAELQAIGAERRALR